MLKYFTALVFLSIFHLPSPAMGAEVADVAQMEFALSKTSPTISDYVHGGQRVYLDVEHGGQVVLQCTPSPWFSVLSYRITRFGWGQANVSKFEDINSCREQLKSLVASLPGKTKIVIMHGSESAKIEFK